MSGILGIDLSLTGTGLALICPSFSEAEAKYGKIPLAHRAQPGERCLLVAVNTAGMTDLDRWNEIRSMVSMMAENVSLVVMEGYAFAAPFQREALAEIGGIVRWTLMSAGRKIVTVAPATLKKFLTGSGKADKAVILKECLKRYHVDVDQHDLADAYVLARMGEAIQYGCGGLPQFQVEIIQQLLHGKPKKAKKAKV